MEAQDFISGKSVVNIRGYSLQILPLIAYFDRSEDYEEMEPGL